MGKKAKAGRSFFSNLPLDLRSSLRSQTLLPLIPGANINDLEKKQEALEQKLGLGPGNDYLPTQPSSPGSSDEEDAVTGNAESSTSAMRKRDLEVEPVTPTPTANRAGKKQKITNGMDTKTNGKGKGKGKAVEGNGNGGASGNGERGGNRFKGHRWDCTGLVQRYTKPTEMPQELVKCKSSSISPMISVCLVAV
jgi:hypothetical protein